MRHAYRHDAPHWSFSSRTAISAPRAHQPRHDRHADRGGGGVCLRIRIGRNEAAPILYYPSPQPAAVHQHHLEYVHELNHCTGILHHGPTASELHHPDTIRHLRCPLRSDLRRGAGRRPRTRPTRRLRDHRLSDRGVEPDLVGRDPPTASRQGRGPAHCRAAAHRFHLDRQGVRTEPRGLRRTTAGPDGASARLLTSR